MTGSALKKGRSDAARLPDGSKPCEALAEQVDRWTARFVELWNRCPTSTPVLGEIIPRSAKRRHERAANRLLDDLETGLERFPASSSDASAWRRELQCRVRGFVDGVMGFSESYRRLLLSDDFFDALVSFVTLARRFDRGLRIEDVYQALRNVWIGGSVQLLIETDVTSSPALFAYSMLYPYTDNHLDDPAVPIEGKRMFSRRLDLRLRGVKLPPRNGRELAVFRLVSMIEAEFPRVRHRGVFESLLAIHRAQGTSLDQQSITNGDGAELSFDELLTISVRKGGTSVLADGYVVAGSCPADRSEFLFGYGVFLQFLDDLQDAVSDRANGHWTLFSSDAGRRNLDLLTNRLIHFMDRVLESAACFPAPGRDAIVELIRRNCTLLILHAIGIHPSLFSRGYRREMERYSLFRSAYVRKQRKRLPKRRHRAQARLRRATGLTSIFDVLVSDDSSVDVGVTEVPPLPSRSSTGIL